MSWRKPFQSSHSHRGSWTSDALWSLSWTSGPGQPLPLLAEVTTPALSSNPRSSCRRPGGKGRKGRGGGMGGGRGVSIVPSGYQVEKVLYRTSNEMKPSKVFFSRSHTRFPPTRATNTSTTSLRKSPSWHSSTWLASGSLLPKEDSRKQPQQEMAVHLCSLFKGLWTDSQ